MSAPTLLTINAGSSSVKFRAFRLDKDLLLLSGGKVSGIGGAPTFEAQIDGKVETKQSLPPETTQETALAVILDWLSRHRDRGGSFHAAAHRIVHGGTRYEKASRLDPDAMTYLRSLSALAPLHQPHNLGCVDILARVMPDLKQYGCFDTAFHARHDPVAANFALPRHLRDAGIRRYGFHGLSYDWIVHCLRHDHPALAKGRVIAAHLGNGASLCAIKNGQSIDTTMGMTALDGLPMGTRCGWIDAGAVLYMQRTLGLSPEKTEHLLYEESGLLGLSGISNDVKTLAVSDSADARFALDYLARKTAQFIAFMAAAIGGMDGLVFTGGIGENAMGVRQAILEYLDFMPDFETIIIPADEERSMAREIAENFLQELVSA